MKDELTGRERYRCTDVSLGGYGRSQATSIVILELECRKPKTGDYPGKTYWRYATYADLSATEDLKQ